MILMIITITYPRMKSAYLYLKYIIRCMEDTELLQEIVLKWKSMIMTS